MFTILLAAMISCFFIFDMTSWSSRSIIVVTALLVLVYLFWKDAQIRFRFADFHKHVLAFAAYVFLTAAWSWDPKATLERTFTVLLVFICMAVIYLIYDESEYIDGYLQAIMISGIIVSAYTVVFFGVDRLRVATEVGGRFDSEEIFASANAIGMWMAICTIVFVYKIVNTKFKLWYLLGIAPIIMLAVSQSRTALIEALVGVALIILFKTQESKRVSKKIGNLIFGLIVLALAGYALTQFDLFAGLYDRVRSALGLSAQKKEGSWEMRQQMIQIGLQQFKKTPIFGIGFGSTHVLTDRYLGHNTYLHNNFVEVLVSGGIIGFVLYYSMHWFVIKILWKLRALDKNVQLPLILMIVHLLSDFGTVSFYKKPTYVILTLGFLAVVMAKRQEKSKVDLEKNDSVDSGL